jgi:hypothetical protein
MQARDERGVAFPSPLVMLSVVAVALAAVAFVATDDRGGREMQTVSKPSPTATPTPTVAPAPAPAPKPRPAPPVKRGSVYVEVYNNSGVSGLAGRTAAKATAAGWQVVGSDNWVGTIPAPTVYYPPRLERAARLLGKDLGIKRLRPAVQPMRLDRLTVILTAGYA